MKQNFEAERAGLKEIINLTKNYILDMKKSGVSYITVDSGQCPGHTHKAKTLQQFYEEIKDCRKCPLWRTRTNFVFGEGSPDAELVFIGEAPGYEEDKQGRPFVGRAGQLLNKIIEAMGMKREDVYICNVLKSRPPENRAPLPSEVEACRPYLLTQLSLLRRKKVICCLGLHAAHGVLRLDLPMKEMRGNWYEYAGTRALVTYHPAYLLRNPDDKRKVWNDMKKVKEILYHENTKTQKK